MPGYLKVPADIFSHPLWTEFPLNPGQAYLDLYGLAVDKPWTCHGVEVKPGQYLTSIRQLAKRWKRGRGKVRDYLLLLSCNGLITMVELPRSQELPGGGLLVTMTDYQQRGYVKNWAQGPAEWWENVPAPKLFDPGGKPVDRGGSSQTHPPDRKPGRHGSSAEPWGGSTAGPQKYCFNEILKGDAMQRKTVTAADVARHRETLNRIANLVGGVYTMPDRRYLVRIVIAAETLGTGWLEGALTDLEELHNQGRQPGNRLQYCRERWEASARTIAKTPLQKLLMLIDVDPKLITAQRQADDVAQV